MSSWPELHYNKGTLSSALGKQLAHKVLTGDRKILPEAINLTFYQADNLMAKTFGLVPLEL